MQGKILFISDVAPANTFASAVIFYRHLKMVEQNGWTINLLLPRNALNLIDSGTIPVNWSVRVLPNRRWWYPPYQPFGILQYLRYKIMFLEASSFLQEDKPNLVIGYMAGTFFSGFSAFVARSLKVPYYVFYHDKSELFPGVFRNPQLQEIIFQNNARIINQAKVVWSVSKKLMYDKPEWNKKFKVLLPIPELIENPIIEWKENFSTQPVLAYAGTLYNEAVGILMIIGRLLKQVNGKLLILTHQIDNVNILKQHLDNVEYEAPKEDIREACSYISKNATAMIVAYPEELQEMPWIESCFPSKFVQFAHTGLPQLVIAPEKSALAAWCMENNWLGYTKDYSESSIINLVRAIILKESWEMLQQQSLEYTRSCFNPENIQTAFEEDLKTAI